MYNHLETLRALQNLVTGKYGQPALSEEQKIQANAIINAAPNNAAPVDKLQQFKNTPEGERDIIGMPSRQSALNAGFAPLGTPAGGFPDPRPAMPVSTINTSQQLKYDAPLPTGLDSSQQSAIDAGFSSAGESQFDVDGSTMPMPMQGMGNTMQALASAGELAKALEEKPLQPVFTSPTVRAYQPVANPYAQLDLQERPRMGLKLSNI